MSGTTASVICRCETAPTGRRPWRRSDLEPLVFELESDLVFPYHRSHYCQDVASGADGLERFRPGLATIEARAVIHFRRTPAIPPLDHRHPHSVSSRNRAPLQPDEHDLSL